MHNLSFLRIYDRTIFYNGCYDFYFIYILVKNKLVSIHKRRLNVASSVMGTLIDLLQGQTTDVLWSIFEITSDLQNYFNALSHP